MFEGFPDGDEEIDWADENNLSPPLKFWQLGVILGVLWFIVWGTIDLCRHA